MDCLVGCCLGMGCDGHGREPHPDTGAPLSPFKPLSTFRAHHRIVRIPPSEAVVLNSADRAPFLVHVEILRGDLDFDPSRRQNAEEVRQVVGERESAIARQSYRSGEGQFGTVRKVQSEDTSRTGTAAVLDGLGIAMRKIRDETAPVFRGRPKRPATHSRDSSRTADEFAKAPQMTSPSPLASIVNSPISADPSELDTPSIAADEEVDLVEQLYGNQSLRTASPPEPESFSPVIHHRQIDEAAWNRTERKAPPTSLSLGRRPSNPQPRPAAPPDTAPENALASTSDGSMTSLPSGRRPVTLNEYADRMRMAAIMLSQLSASQQPVVGTAGVFVGAGAGIVGAGLDAVRGRLPSFGRRESMPGQASSGVATKIDPAGAASGLSAVQDTVALPTVASSPITQPGTPQSARQKILPPAEASAIRERIMGEMIALEEERMERLKGDSRNGWSTSGPTGDEDESVILRAVRKEDPSGEILGESWTDKKARIRAGSPYGHLINWDVLSVIVKTGADLRQEQLAVQLIKEFGRIWSEAQCPYWVR